jgi:hypothetical protein
MKKQILTLMVAAISITGFAQVGVGTADPKTTLDVVGAAGDTPGALSIVDGIAVPIVTDDMTTTVTGGTKVSQLVYSNNAASTGFYFWSGAAWTAMSSSAGAPNYGTEQEINVTVPAQLDISASNNNHFKITGGALFGTNELTMPTPSVNKGRIIVIDNATNSSTISWTNNVGGVPLVNAQRTVLVFCNGIGWSLVTQD